ncbi:sister chromatid cohesion protein PDS5 homolog A-A isoform X4 [Punica granatum]|nr:sister chromatid cohesion protein PDS5 homolog A-A isoform X4 [Punica granatum]
MSDSVLGLISRIGNQIVRQSRLNKDFLVKNLRQAANELSQVEQPSAVESAERSKEVETALKPLIESFTKNDLALHKDKDVRLLVTICATELFRIMAPEPPFEEDSLLAVFKLIVSTFADLADMESPYFSKRAKILETFARLGLCMIMLDIECYNLIVEMFKVLFSVAREQHERSLTKNILSILKQIINEDASDELLEVILQNLLKEEKGVPSASSQIAVSIIQMCCEKLKPFIHRFLTSCMFEKETEGSALRKSYHEIIYKIFVNAPQMLFAIIPNILHELLNNDADVRRKAVQLLGRIFAELEHLATQDYHSLFMEFLNRFSDKSMEVRISALQCVKGFFMANPSGSEVQKILLALEARLLDLEDRVRTEAVTVICDIAISNMNAVPRELVVESTERLRDKSSSVRKKALWKLMEVYRVYCSKCSEGCMTISNHFEQISCKVLMLCYVKNCKEFRSHEVELLLAEELFPVLTPLEITRHWIHMFSLFESPHLKALNSILSQKRRFQLEMQRYLGLRRKEKQEVSSDEMEKKVRLLFKKLSASFPDPAKAEASFYMLDQLKDSYIFNVLSQLLDEMSIVNALNTREEFLQRIRERRSQVEFLSSVSSKCSFNIFSLEHVQHILDYLSDGFGCTHQEAAAKLLLAVVDYCPSLLRGSEVKLCTILEKNEQMTNEIMDALAKAGSQISIRLSDIYHLLERTCISGSRRQAKSAVSAIAAIMQPSDESALSELCKKLLYSLHSGVNMPTVLQSLGCIAKHFISTAEDFDRQITQFIETTPSNDLDLSDENCGCSKLCKLKTYGLKTLVNSFLPHAGTHVRRNINQLLEILEKMLHKGNTVGDTILSESDRAHIRLAAAKSVLRLSKRWDLFITPEIFSLTVSMVKDCSSFVKRSFLEKTYKLLKEHAVPSRYACALALATSDGEDLQNDSLKYMSKFIKEYSLEDQTCQSSTVQGVAIPGYPAYIIVYLVYVLAHDADFPPEECADEQILAHFCSPLFFLIRALVDANKLKGDLDLVIDPFSSLAGLLKAIRKAEDAVDAERTPKLHILSQIGWSFAMSLNNGSTSFGRTPDVVLLPSAYYRANNTKEFVEYSWGERFIRRIIQNFNSYILEGKPQDTKILALEKVAPVILGQKRERVTMPEGESAVEFPTVKHKRLSSKQNQRKERCVLSSCNSMSEVTILMRPQEKSQNEGIDDGSIKEITEAVSAVTVGPPAYSRAKRHDQHCLKEICQNRHVQMGKQSNLILSMESFHPSYGDGFKAQNNTSKTPLNSGDSKITCLEIESSETRSSDSLEAGVKMQETCTCGFVTFTFAGSFTKVTVLVEETQRSSLQHRKTRANGSRGDVTVQKQKAYTTARRKGTMA